MRPQLALVWSASQRGDGGHDERTDQGQRTGNGGSHTLTVLVVEDEVLIRLAVCDYLRDCGYRVLEASSGEEARAVFVAGEAVEVVFSDVNLAGEMNGFALAAWVRERYADVRVILTSGVARVAQEAGALCAEGHFLPKPYSFEALADRIKTLLGAFDRQRG